MLARLGRLDENAIRAFRNSITYNGENATAGRFGPLVAAAGGVVTGEAKAEFERAVALNADEVKANYFLGLAAQQDGHAAEAASIWRTMLAKAPPDAPWRPLVQSALVQGRRRAGARPVERRDGRGERHERDRSQRHDPHHGRASRHPIAPERR